jgi:hypothetical protein
MSLTLNTRPRQEDEADAADEASERAGGRGEERVALDEGEDHGREHADAAER